MKRVTCAELLLGAASLLGCYRFQPATIEAVPRGSMVRAVLAPVASERLRERHGIEGRTLSGTVMATNGETVSLWVASGPRRPESSVPAPCISRWMLLGRTWCALTCGSWIGGKTTLAALSGAAAVVIVARGTIFGGGPGNGTGTGGVPPESRRRWVLPVLVRF
jgi:hypothetical protein